MTSSATTGRVVQRLGLRRRAGQSVLATAVLCGAAFAVSDGASAATSMSVSGVDIGKGKIFGVDFVSTGAFNGAFGAFSTVVSSDPTSVKFGAPQNGKPVMTSRSAMEWSSGPDRIFGVSDGTYVFEPGRLPDGSPGPDLTKPVDATVSITVTGGTGRFHRSTGTIRESGVITPSATPPTGPIADVSYSFKAEGSIEPDSGGATGPVRLGPDNAARTAAASRAVPMPTTPGPVPAGVYTVEFRDWVLTLQLGDGWRNNGLDKESLGLTNGPLNQPFATGVVIYDSPWIVSDPTRPGSVAPLLADTGGWLQSIPGMSAPAASALRIGRTGGTSHVVTYDAPSPAFGVIPLLFLRSSNQAVPLFSGRALEVQTYRSPGGGRLLVSAAGGLDPRRALDAMVLSIERR